MDIHAVTAIVGIILVAVGGLMGYAAWVFANMRADTKERLEDTKERLKSIQKTLDIVDERMRRVEHNGVRTDERLKGYDKQSERCMERFDSILDDLKKLKNH